MRIGNASVETVNLVKWIATVVQLIGYGLTGLNYSPLNVYAFIVGIILWFIVGILWKDRAIMVVHIGAFLSLTIGYMNRPLAE